MVSTSGGTDSPSNEIKKAEGEEGIWALPSKLSQLKKQIQASRVDSIREKVTNNGKNLEVHTSILLVMASSKKDISITDENDAKNMLSYRISNSLCKLSGSDSGSVEKEIINSQEELSSSTILFGNNNNGKSLVRLIKLPFIEKIPPYTTWIFLNRNQRMAEDQSVVGRRQIYYDQYGSEALICSDSEEEVAEPEEEKHEFSDGEDQILWKALQEHGLNQEVFDILRQFVDATSSEIEERYEVLLEKYEESNVENSMSSSDMESHKTLFLEKTLSTALDSFDNLFCRRCLIFDCRLHGCSQSLISPSEKQLISLELEDYRKPCSDQCYLRGREDVQNIRSDMSDTSPIETVPSAEEYFLPLASAAEKSDPVNERTDLTVPEGRGTDLIVSTDKVDACRIATHVATIDTDLRNSGKRKVLKHESLQLGTTKHGIEKLLVSADKKQKKLPSSDVVSVINEGLLDVNLTCRRKFECRDSGELNDDQLQRKAVSESTGDHTKTDETEGNENSAIEVYVVKNSSNSRKGLDAHGWNPIEKDLYLKGIEIFGKNSCLIARNLLSGLKTCMEVSNYMFNDDAAILSRPMFTKPCLDDNVTNPDYMEQEMPKRTRIWRRRGRARKLKYTWKSAGHPSSRKRIADGKQQSCKQYSPCGCQLMCGKQCPCLDNGTCCEKYCGCSKSCKNRFRGCHCAKSQCRSRQCPCFAAGRECDPDVCRNCWVSCGDGSLGEPPTRGEDYQCGNMKLLLKQQKRILLGKSDVAGWGAFIKNPVNKHDYLGEYTGELISHKEADKRGKIYDRANSSFLFDLNDQYVLDAYRKGDELKFANHSSNPNCYAKVMLVAGDHRVGIFANEHIEASEELFYDYRYGPDQAPAWARKPEGSRREDSTVSHGRAQKIA